MTQKGSLKTIGVVLTFAAIIATGMLSSSTLVRAHGYEGADEGEEARIDRGLAIAPVDLNLENKDRDLVGLGSYWVNAVYGLQWVSQRRPRDRVYRADWKPLFSFAAIYCETTDQPGDLFRWGARFWSLPRSAISLNSACLLQKLDAGPHGAARRPYV